MSKVYVGDVGTVILLDVGQDITGASALSIEARRPDGTAATWAATLSGTTKVRFVTVAGSLNQPGDWLLQARVTLPTGTWLGETVKLRVNSPFA